MAASTGPLEHAAQQDYEQRLIQRIRDGEHEAFDWARLPEDLRESFTEAVLNSIQDSDELHYVRLNIDAA